jgi:translation initiation factor IF-2
MAEKVITIADSITVGELADTLNLPVVSLVGELFKNGIVATVNQKLDFETVSIIIEELGIDAEVARKQGSGANSERVQYQLSDKAVARPPIVAVMGHVDHGKTSLLDAILGIDVVAGEAGGITQHISAYQTNRSGRSITLLDTPGHEAFAALRQHGAVLTDVVIIVVAADDGVKPQTIEAIKFARSANAKIVVAINKIDKTTADPARVKAQLASEHNLNPEEWGGDTIMVEVSAKTGENIDKLLDMVLLVADLEDLRADIDVPAQGLVIESHLETGRGAVVGLLVEQGTLRPGHFLVAGTAYGKVRTLLDFAGKTLKEAGPATPVTITGFKEIPKFGDTFGVVKSEKDAKRQTQLAKIENDKNTASANVTSGDILKLMSQQREAREFHVIIKADVQGSLTSVMDSLKLIDTEGEVIIKIVHSGIGPITENDIRSAVGGSEASPVVIYGFNVPLSPAIKKVAVRDRVEVRMYDVIYELIDDARNTIESLLAPEIVENEIGSLLVKGVFRTLKEESIVGGEVTNGKVTSGLLVRVIRGGEKIAEAEVTNVQRSQQEAKEVFEGEMCGLNLKTTKKVLIEEGDRLEFFTREVVKRHLK